jgi:transcription termination/antitermination protein NusA
MKNEFILAFNEVIEEKQLPKEIILQALEAAMVSAYRRDVNASSAQHVEAKIDPDTGKVVIFAEKEVVDTVQDPRTEVSLEEARKYEPETELGGMVVVETTPKDFGRVAAQTARQVIQQRIREAERDTQMNHFGKQVGEILSGIVQAVTAQGLTMGLDMKAEGLLPRNQQMPGERFRVHDRIQALLMEVKQSNRGPQIILSRAHRNFLRRLLENEVPEIYHGLVEIRSIAREPGQRSKVAVSALQPAVDPVGACVGIRGVRIQAIVRELNDEKIDVIEWNSDPSIYISKALSPARVNGVYLNDISHGAKTATVVVPEDQLSLAIGRDGQNARLAAKLTGWRIDIKSLPEAASDSLHKLESDPEYAFLAEGELELKPQLEHILAKKAEGRPVTPEEYQVLAQFVDRVERGMFRKRESERRAEDIRYKELRATIPDAAFNMYLDDLPLSSKLYDLLTEAGYDTVGSVMLQLKLDPDVILALGGIGPRSMDEIKSILSTLEFPEAVEEAPAEEPVLPDAAVEEVVAEVESEGIASTIESTLIEEAPAAEILEAVELGAESEPTAEAELVAAPAEVGEEVLEETTELDQLFTLRPETFERDEEDEEEEEDLASKKGKKGKKKKRKAVEMEYDPDLDIMVVKRKHKRGEWEDTWEL